MKTDLNIYFAILQLQSNFRMWCVLPQVCSSKLTLLYLMYMYSNLSRSLGVLRWPSWAAILRSKCGPHDGPYHEDASDLFDVFGRQLAGIGKMLMCLDKMREGHYTTRIWCIFEARPVPVFRSRR